MRREDVYCPFCGNKEVVADGTYPVKRTGQTHQRFLCKNPECRKSFSSTHFTGAFHHKKKDLNPEIFNLLSSGMSRRDISRYLKVGLKTVQAKILEIGKACEAYHRRYLAEAGLSISHASVDELLTYSHTRLNAIAIVGASFALTEANKTRPFIIDARVATFPPTGYWANKYNEKLRNGEIEPRPNTRSQKLREVLQSCRQVLIRNQSILTSDEARSYGPIISHELPHTIHRAYPSKKLWGTDQEKQATQSLNHTFARMRGQVRPLQRIQGKYTAKNLDFLQAQLYCFICHHNRYDFTAIINYYPIKIQSDFREVA